MGDSTWVVLVNLAGFWLSRESDKAVIDDIPFQLQYQVTTTFLFLSSVLITMTELVGKQICFVLRMLKEVLIPRK